uniref:C2orf72-like C-terminal domain-containing protein n=1 Tax=Varanus komodoensis TaxID=61221 RepID=A0A8D2L7C9_VARKO
MELLELEFVTLQFMMGGNVHLLGELQSQAVVEDFRQEVFAKFPIPAFHVTSSVICCDKPASPRPEKPQILNENSCSRQQERIYSQLIFFLCRAPFLKSWEQLDRLAEMLHKLKSCIYYNPVALVGVIVQVDPDPGLDAEQEARARRWLRCLLDGFFCCDLLLDHDGTEPDVQVQVAVYQSGQPARALEVKRAACQAIRAALKGAVEAIFTSLSSCTSLLLDSICWGVYWKRREGRSYPALSAQQNTVPSSLRSHSDLAEAARWIHPPPSTKGRGWIANSQFRSWSWVFEISLTC